MFKAPLLDIPQKLPFENDKLQRESVANGLTDIILNTGEPFVLAIDAEWGAGKTTFIKMWRQDLMNKKFPVVYFNAWENDFLFDPLVSFVSAIVTDIDIEKTLKGSAVAKANEYLKGIKDIGKRILSSTSMELIALAEKGSFGTNIVSSVMNDPGKDIYKLISSQRNEMNSFRIYLNDFVGALNSNKKVSKPIIFFIDELDRCKPTYTILLLERLKHFFNVEGIFFVLSLDKLQLSHSIKAVYGNEFDANKYLKRFFDLEFSLPTPDFSGHRELVSYYLTIHGVDSVFDAASVRYIDCNRDLAIDLFCHLIRIFDFKIRDLEKIITRLTVVLRSISPGMPIFMLYLILLMFYREFDKNAYLDYVADKGDSERAFYELVFDRNSSVGFDIQKIEVMWKTEAYISYGNKLYSKITTQLGNRDEGGRIGRERSITEVMIAIVTKKIQKHETLVSYLNSKLMTLEQFDV